jgi:hypothetical protein
MMRRCVIFHLTRAPALALARNRRSGTARAIKKNDEIRMSNDEIITNEQMETITATLVRDLSFGLPSSFVISISSRLRWI